MKKSRTAEIQETEKSGPGQYNEDMRLTGACYGIAYRFRQPAGGCPMKRILSFLAVTAAVFCVVLSGCKKTPAYETKVFQTGMVHTVDIAVSEGDWNDLL